MTFEEFCETTLANLDNIFRIVELILLGYLGRKVRNVAPIKTKIFTTSATSSPSSTVEEAPAQKPKTVKKDLCEKILADIDLLFSDKSDADLSEDEKQRVSALLGYLEGRGHEV